MKLKKLFEATDEILTEGLRFGKKEEAQVLKRSKDIRVGIEYEFHVNQEFQGDLEAYDEAVSDRAYELMKEDVEEKRDSFIEDYADNNFSEYSIGDITMNLKELRDLALEAQGAVNNAMEDEDSVQNYIDAWEENEWETVNDEYFRGFEDKDEFDAVESFLLRATEAVSILQQVADKAQELEGYDYIDDFWPYFGQGEIDLHSIYRQAEELWEYYDELPQSINDEDDMQQVQANSFVSGSDFMDAVIDAADLEGDDSDWDDEWKEKMTDSAEDLWDSEKEYYLGYDPDDGTDDQFHEAAMEEIDRDEYEDAPKHIKEKMEEEGIDTSLFADFTTDSSVENGVEIITEPLPLQESHDLMDEMFMFISDVGYTSTSTGMHVNMSLRNIKFTKENFDPLKLVMLMDEKYMMQQFQDRRHYATEYWVTISPSDLFDFASASNGQHMLEMARRKFVDEQKFRSINFGNTFKEHLDSTRRVEFRFFGGDDYEDDYEKMVFEINRAAYMLEAAFNDEFGYKEYMKKIHQALNRISERYYGMDFLEFAKGVNRLSNDALGDIDRVAHEASDENQLTAAVDMKFALLHTKPFRKYVPEFTKSMGGRQLEDKLQEKYKTKRTDVATSMIQVK